MADSHAVALPGEHEAEEVSSLADEKQPLVGPARGDSATADADVENASADKGGESEPATSSMLFNWGDRPPQDVPFGRIFLVAMAGLLIRELAAFLLPTLGLRFFDPAHLSLEPLLSTLLGLAFAVPGCFVLLAASWRLRASAVRVCLVLGVAFFLLSLFPPGSLIRRELGGISLVKAHRVSQAEASLGNVLNAGVLGVILCSCQDLLPLVALIVSDSAKFVLTRGRGLVLAVLAAVAAMVLTALPAMAVVLQVSWVCQAEFSPTANPDAQPSKHLCRTWIALLLDTAFSFSFLPMLCLFLALWLITQVQYLLQFITANVVGQCYGIKGATVDKDDAFSVISATRCAFNESLGSISLLSLTSAAAFRSSVLLAPNFPATGFLGASFIQAAPLLLYSVASFALSLFLACFVLPLMAITGQSVKDAAKSAVELVQENLGVAVAVTIVTINVIGVLVFFVLAATVVLALVAGFVLESLGGLVGVGLAGVEFKDLVLIHSGMVFAMAVCAGTLFYWVFSATISTLFLCLALEGKANASTLSTPLIPER